MNNKAIIVTIILMVVVLVGILVGYSVSRPTEVDLTEFAQCLSSKDVTMYGAYWCPHCQNQKKLFGEAFKYVPYVECTQEADKCLKVGANQFPTWMINGQKFMGEQTLEDLARESSCSLPPSK